MGAGLLAVKNGFILINRIYQFFNNKHAKRARERVSERENALEDLQDLAIKVIPFTATSEK